MESRRKSRLIREMARDLSIVSSTGSNHGTVSTDSTTTSFNPEKDEAAMSTRKLDNNYSQKLPEIRTTAKKYGRWAPRQQTQTDIVINTSAIGRAFPGFSQGGSSDDSMSFEIGRVPKNHKQRLSPARAAHHEYSDNVESPDVATTIGSFKILGTPQRPSTKSTSSHKENIPPPQSQQPSNPSPYVSHASRSKSGERRTLKDLHAQVTDDNTNGSFTGYERPSPITVKPKNARFTATNTRTVHNSQTSHTANVSSKRQEGDDDLSAKLRTASGTPSKSAKKQQTNHMPNTPHATQQSFTLPNMPESSHIISASFNRGTGVPFPDEEQDIYVKIDLLMERVADLEGQLIASLDSRHKLEDDISHWKQEHAFAQGERFRVDVERVQAVSQLAESLKQIEELRQENRQLKQQQASAQSDWITIRTERDQAVHQLSESFKRNERLEVENQDLKHQRSEALNEIEGLRQQRLQALDEIKDLQIEVKESKIELAAVRKLAEDFSVDTTHSLQDSRTHIMRQGKAINKLKQVMDQSLTKKQRKEVEEFDVSADSSYADILGPGYIRKIQSQTTQRHQTTQDVADRITHNEQPKSAPQPSVQDTSFATTISRGHRQTTQDLTDRLPQNERPKSAPYPPAKDTTFATNISHRRRQTEDMTSAYIIPDISHPSLSASARQVFDGLCKHECANCTICTRVASFNTKNHAQSKSEVTIPKPVPVSKRMPEPTPYEDEPTIRPSVKPSIALATVIKGLEDEVTHLKEEHERISAAYIKHDASLGMRHRKALKKRLDELVAAIEQKSDQVYGLYDVLEGEGDKETGGGDITEELPWEGIED